MGELLGDGTECVGLGFVGFGDAADCIAHVGETVEQFILAIVGTLKRVTHGDKELRERGETLLGGDGGIALGEGAEDAEEPDDRAPPMDVDAS